MDFGAVNYLAVIVAAVAGVAVGAVWYSVIFSRAWMAAVEIPGKQMKQRGGSATPFILSGIAYLLMAMFLSALTAPASVMTGAVAGFLVWLGFMLTTTTVNNAYPGGSRAHHDRHRPLAGRAGCHGRDSRRLRLIEEATSAHSRARDKTRGEERPWRDREEDVMSEKVYPVPPSGRSAPMSMTPTIRRCTGARSTIRTDSGASEAKRIDWIKPFTKVKNTTFNPPVSIKWFEDGTLNVSANCLDRHLATRGDQVAIIWEGDDPTAPCEDHLPRTARRGLPLRQRAEEAWREKGDRITIYMPMIPEAAIAMLACTRIGAIHSVVFGGFSPDSLSGRIDDCKSHLVITADEGRARRQEWCR